MINFLLWMGKKNIFFIIYNKNIILLFINYKSGWTGWTVVEPVNRWTGALTGSMSGSVLITMDTSIIRF